MYENNILEITNLTKMPRNTEFKRKIAAEKSYTFPIRDDWRNKEANPIRSDHKQGLIRSVPNLSNSFANPIRMRSNQIRSDRFGFALLVYILKSKRGRLYAS